MIPAADSFDQDKELELLELELEHGDEETRRKE